MLGAGSWLAGSEPSQRLSVAASISGRLIEVMCIPGSIQRAKKIGSIELVAHITMSAPLIASSGCATGTTLTPSFARHLTGEGLAVRFVGLKQRIVSMSRVAHRHKLSAGLPA